MKNLGLLLFQFTARTVLAALMAASLFQAFVSAASSDVALSAEPPKQSLLVLGTGQAGTGQQAEAAPETAPEDKTDRLVRAAASGNLDQVKTLLGEGADLEKPNRHGLNPLHAARTRGQQEIEEFLLAQGANPNPSVPPVEVYHDSVLKEHTRGLSPGIALLAAQDGEILFQRGYGLANLEHRVPVTADTKFRIGSVTKQFTAAAILRLQEQGKLSVQDKLSKFIPDYPRGDEVTIHHLLAHTSGIRSYTSKPDFMASAGLPIEPEELIGSFKGDPFDFDPGTKWAYNNSGYFLLGYIIEKTSGLSYGDYLKQHFFDPLGMKDTGVHEARAILEHEAHGYAHEDGKIKKSVNWDMSRAGAAGALYSTVGDLFRWNEAVFNGKVLSEASLEAAHKPVSTTTGNKPDAGAESGYGYGWAVDKRRGLTCVSHGGGLHGFQSYLLRYPKENFTVAVLVNALAAPPGLNPAARAQEIAELYLWKKMQARRAPAVNPSVASGSYDAIAGHYDYGRGLLEVTREGDRLFAQLTGQPRFEIFPKSETEYFWKVVEANVTFVKSSDGEVVKAIHRQGGLEIEAPKVTPPEAVALDPSVAKAYAGRYDYGGGKAIMTVTHEEGRLFAQLKGQPKFEIFAKSEDEFFWKIVHAQVKFKKDEQGRVIKAIHTQGGRTIEAPRMD